MSTYVLNHKTDGVFLGFALGLAFFSKLDSAGQPSAPTFKDATEAKELIDLLVQAGLDESDLALEAVSSGHWTSLQEAGLEIGEMAQDELMYGNTMGNA